MPNTMGKNARPRLLMKNVSFEISSNWTMVSQSTYSKEPFELIGDIELIDLDIGNEKQIFIDYANKFLTLYKKYNK